MTSVRDNVYWLILATLLQLAVPISECGADEDVDCFYSCIEGDPQASVDYYMARDGGYVPVPSPYPVYVPYPPPAYVCGPTVDYYMARDGGYIRVPSPPPVHVRGPAVYYDHGYPVRVGSEPPDYPSYGARSDRRERWRREVDEWHNEQVRKYHK
jgi:hypothetical protein